MYAKHFADTLSLHQFEHLALKCYLHLRLIRTNVCNGTSTHEGEQLRQVIFNSIDNVGVMLQTRSDGRLSAEDNHLHVCFPLNKKSFVTMFLTKEIDSLLQTTICFQGREKQLTKNLERKETSGNYHFINFQRQYHFTSTYLVYVQML